MTAEILTFDGPTSLDISDERVLNAAIDQKITGVVVVGYDANGDVYMSSSKGSMAEILWMLETAKKILLDL